MVDPNCLYLYLVFLTKQVCIFAWVLGQNYIIIIIYCMYLIYRLQVSNQILDIFLCVIQAPTPLLRKKLKLYLRPKAIWLLILPISLCTVCKYFFFYKGLPVIPDRHCFSLKELQYPV